MTEFVRGDLAAVGRTTMFHPDHDLKVTLYPVFHVGSPAFYKALSDDLLRFHVFLLEGIRWRGWRGPVYDLVAGNHSCAGSWRTRLGPGTALVSPWLQEQPTCRLST